MNYDRLLNRCQQCGWDNAPDLSYCAMCDADLIYQEEED